MPSLHFIFQLTHSLLSLSIFSSISILLNPITRIANKHSMNQITNPFLEHSTAKLRNRITSQVPTHIYSLPHSNFRSITKRDPGRLNRLTPLPHSTQKNVLSQIIQLSSAFQLQKMLLSFNTINMRTVPYS